MVPSWAVKPIKTGKAPGIAPMATAIVEYLFMGVYTNAYKTNETMPSIAVIGLNVANIKIPAKQDKPAKSTASAVRILPAANGLLDVRNIKLSKSFSNTWFKAFAAEVTKNPPRIININERKLALLPAAIKYPNAEDSTTTDVSLILINNP